MTDCAMNDHRTEEIYLAGGCLWGVQEFLRHIPGVINTEAGRANGSTQSLDEEYDGYVECVRTIFDPTQVSVARLIEYLFEIIDPYSMNKQGPDEGRKYRTGVYSKSETHLKRLKYGSDPELIRLGFCSLLIVEVLLLKTISQVLLSIRTD